MRTQFFIAVHINTANGPETIARFRIGNNPQQASQIFYLLKGDDHVGGTDTLRLDFMEMKNGLLINLRMISCTSDQLAENCKIITEELFMFSGLRELKESFNVVFSNTRRFREIPWPDLR